MAKVVPEIQETFPTGEGTLNIFVGNFDGQLGVSTVRLDSEVKAIASFINAPLGLSSDCKGKQVIIFTDIRDVLGETDDTSLTITINDSSGSKSLFYSEQAEGSGEAVSYKVTINLN